MRKLIAIALATLTLGACAPEVTAVSPPAGGYVATVDADGVGTLAAAPSIRRTRSTQIYNAED